MSEPVPFHGALLGGVGGPYFIGYFKSHLEAAKHVAGRNNPGDTLLIWRQGELDYDVAPREFLIDARHRVRPK